MYHYKHYYFIYHNKTIVCSLFYLHVYIFHISLLTAVWLFVFKIKLNWKLNFTLTFQSIRCICNWKRNMFLMWLWVWRVTLTFELDPDSVKMIKHVKGHFFQHYCPALGIWHSTHSPNLVNFGPRVGLGPPFPSFPLVHSLPHLLLFFTFPLFFFSFILPIFFFCPSLPLFYQRSPTAFPGWRS